MMHVSNQAPVAVRKTDSSVRPLDPLWQPPAIIWTLLVGQGLAIVLALSPGLTLDRTVYFGLASFGAMWVCLLSLAMLYVLRGPLERLRPAHIALVALGLLLLNTWLAAFAIMQLLGPTLPGTFPDFRTLLLQLSGIALTVGILGFAAFQSHWRAQKLALQAKQSELEAL